MAKKKRAYESKEMRDWTPQDRAEFMEDRYKVKTDPNKPADEDIDWKALREQGDVKSAKAQGETGGAEEGEAGKARPLGEPHRLPDIGVIKPDKVRASDLPMPKRRKK